jgi:putative oxidoreductase
MKHLPNIAGALLGLLFVMAGVVVLFHLAEGPPPEKGSPAEHFMTALAPTGYLTFVKVLEVIGGVLVAIPRSRNFGLLVLGPIIINILAYHAFVTDPKELLSPMLILICLLAAYLLWCGRRQFAGLLGNR